MSDTRIEQLLIEIRDLQAEILEELRDQGDFGKARSDIVFGNLGRSRFMAWVFVGAALVLILAIALKYAG